MFMIQRWLWNIWRYLFFFLFPSFSFLFSSLLPFFSNLSVHILLTIPFLPLHPLSFHPTPQSLPSPLVQLFTLPSFFPFLSALFFAIPFLSSFIFHLRLLFFFLPLSPFLLSSPPKYEATNHESKNMSGWPACTCWLIFRIKHFWLQSLMSVTFG